MKKLMISFLVGLVLVGVLVGASMTLNPNGTYDVEIDVMRGWNLIAATLPSEGIAVDSEIQLGDIKAAWLFTTNFGSLGTNGEYVRAYPNPDFERFNQADDTEMIRNAMWIYVEKDGMLKYNTLENYKELNSRNLWKGWNFVPITSEMVDDFAGSCNIQKAYFWDVANKEWLVFPVSNPREFSWDGDAVFGYGLVIKVSSDCTLGSSTTSPPSLPGGVPGLPSDGSDGIGDSVILSDFPEEINGYNLMTNYLNKDIDCDEIKPQDDIPESFSSYYGTQLCGETIRLEYLDSENDGVFIHFTKITEGLDFYRDYLNLMGISEAVSIDGYTMNRLENHELYWWVNEDYDLIMTQEYTRIDEDTGWQPIYRTANGNNAPTKYFLEQYPPA